MKKKAVGDVGRIDFRTAPSLRMGCNSVIQDHTRGGGEWSHWDYKVMIALCFKQKRMIFLAPREGPTLYGIRNKFW